MHKQKLLALLGTIGQILFPCNALAAPYFTPPENYPQTQANYVLNTARNFCKSQKLGRPTEETSRDNAEFISNLTHQSQLRGWMNSDNANKAVMQVYKKLDRNCDISRQRFQKTLWAMPSWFD